VPELAWVREALESERPHVVARNEAGEVVSVCHSPRSTPRAAEAGVETASEYRGRGRAGAVTLGWAAAIRADGRIPLYSTQWTNTASRAVARRLGLVPYGEDVTLG
jgi:predicted GNAT family acetyltransferase